ILGNKVASGTEIIKELGQEHIETGKPIIYTSADSVFQIAAHEEVVPLEELYKMCKIARTEVCIEKHAVGRIIARPFIGENGNFSRTTNRHDYSLLPPDQTVLDLLKEKQYDVVGIGKISDIFAQQGLTKSFSTKSNSEGMAVLKNLTTQTNIKGLIMANLVEFDSLYGHRNDVEGYAKALELFDKELGSLLPMLKADDLLIITADHGCDPTTASTDHSREYVPLLLYNEHLQGKNLGTRKTFADVAATIATNFNLKKMKYGENLL
nr:phosphopentomutase [Negativicutes bacterium]